MKSIAIADKYLTFSEESKKLLSLEAIELMIDTFNKVWRGICDFFNNGELRKVVLDADSNYSGIAKMITIIITDDDDGAIISRENNTIKFNPHEIICEKGLGRINWMPHELVHVAQDYQYGNSGNYPSWIVEGLADYGQEKFGLYNKEGNWRIPRLISNKRTYEIGYTITAGFFIWIEKNVDASFAKDLNNTVKSGKYNDNYFIEKTGKTVDELWQMYLNSNGNDFIAWIEEYTGSPLSEEMCNKIKSGEFDDELDSYLINITSKTLDDLCTLWES